jgi:hypothetical protein
MRYKGFDRTLCNDFHQIFIVEIMDIRNNMATKLFHVNETGRCRRTIEIASDKTFI